MGILGTKLNASQTIIQTKDDSILRWMYATRSQEVSIIEADDYLLFVFPW